MQRSPRAIHPNNARLTRHGTANKVSNKSQQKQKDVKRIQKRPLEISTPPVKQGQHHKQGQAKQQAPNTTLTNR